MANQAEVPKLTAHPVIGPPADNIAVSKLVVFAVLVPSDGEDTSNKQGHVHTHFIVRS